MTTPTLLEKARDFAVKAHRRIGHKPKHTRAAFDIHLQNVYDLVASVTKDPQTLATAWLHDVVEETPATLRDVEKSFGRNIADMVASLTDVRQPFDKKLDQHAALDRKRIALAGPHAKTVKLADLIDTCRDLRTDDEHVARQYLYEAGTLLEVLNDTDPELRRQAREAWETAVQQVGGLSDADAPMPTAGQVGILSGERTPPHLIRLFTESFVARDIADALRSFDLKATCCDALSTMKQNGIDVASVREKGVVVGFVRRDDLGSDNCGDHLRLFNPGQLLDSDAPIIEVIHALTLYDYAFVSSLGEVNGHIGRGCLNKPVARMWIFGVITLTEMEMSRLIDEHFPDESWTSLISRSRLANAQELLKERARRGQPGLLIECLQLADKGAILIEKKEMLEYFGFESKRTGKRLIKEFQSLRNNLAHAQDIATHDWAAISRIASRLSEVAAFRKR